MVETILDLPIVSKFILPFLLVFFIVFAILKKTKVLGDNQDQINALVSFVIGLIFVGASFQKLMVENLILFLTIAIIVAFVGLLLWGFVTGDSPTIGVIGNDGKGLKWTAGIIITLAVVIAVLWSAGIGLSFFDPLFNQSWSKMFWTNAAFIVVIGLVVAIVYKNNSDGDGDSDDSG